MIGRSRKLLINLLTGLLAASACSAAASNDTGVTSGQLDVIAAQPKSVSCDAPSPLGQYDSYCEGLQVDYFLVPKQRLTPSLTGLKPNISSFVPNLNGTAASANFKGINAAAAAKKYSFAVRYTGVLFIDTVGTYEFQLNSPSGTRLTVNGNTVTFNEGSNSSTPTTGYKFSKAGYIPIELVFFNENSIPSVSLQWQGPLDSQYTILEGSSIQFNCSFLQNMTNSVPAANSALCSGLSATYYSNWKNSSYALATSTASFALSEPALNHWSTDTTPYWANLPSTLHTDFAARYHGQLWVPLAGKYTFKLSSVQSSSLYLGSQNILNCSADNRTTLKAPQTATFEFASSGYYPLGLNYVTQQAGKPGSLRLVWYGPNSPAYKVVTPFRHPCSTFVACTNTSTNGALPAPVVGVTPAGSTIESSTASRSPSLATFIPNSNVTFTLTFPQLDASDPNVEDVTYFVREAIANAAGLKLESVWTVPQLDGDGNVIFPIGAYFTSVTSAQKFYNTMNLRPQTVFAASAGLDDFYPIMVSSPALGTTVAMTTPPQPARSTATLASATGEDDSIPLPPTPASPTVTNAPSPNVSSPTPTPTPQATAAPIPTIPQADTPTPTPNATVFATVAAPVPSEMSPAPSTTPESTSAAPVPAEATPSPTQEAAAPTPAESTPAPTAAAPAPFESTPAPTEQAATPSPAESTPAPTQQAATPSRAESTPAPTKQAATPSPAESTPVPTEQAATPSPAESTPSPTAAAPAPAEPATPPTAEATPTPTAAAPAPTQEAASPIPDAVAPSPAEVPTPTAAAPEISPEAPAKTPETAPTSTPESSTPIPATPSPTPESVGPAPATPPQTPAPENPGTGIIAGGPRHTPTPSVSPNPNTALSYPQAAAPSPAPAAEGPSMPAPGAKPYSPSPAAGAPAPAVPMPTSTANAPQTPPTSSGPSPSVTHAAPAAYPTPAAVTPSSGPVPMPMYSPGVATAPAPSTTKTSPATPSGTTASPVVYGPMSGPSPAPTSAQPSAPRPYSPSPYSSSPRASAMGPGIAPAPGPDGSTGSSSSGSNRGYISGADGFDGPGAPGRPTRSPSPGAVASAPAPAGKPTQTPTAVTGGNAYDHVAPAPAPSAGASSPGLPATYPLPTSAPAVQSPIVLVPTPSGLAYYSAGSRLPTPYRPSRSTPTGVYESPATSPSPSSPSTYFVPYPDAPGGFLVPFPPSYSPTAFGPVPYGIPGSSPVLGEGPVVLSPSTDSSTGPVAVSPSTGSVTRPLYYGFSPSNSGGKPIPYAYYGPATPSTPTRPAPQGPLFGLSPAASAPGSGPMPYSLSEDAPAPGRPLTPSDFFPIAPGPAPGVVGGLVGAPVEAPGPSALCACNPSDTTPRSVKIEVLSTSYNSSSTDTIKYNAYLTFSHPVQSLNSSQIRVFTRQTGEDGSKTTVPGVVTTLAPLSQNCAWYSLKGYVTESNPFIDNSTDIYLGAGGANLLDACGEPFNVTVTEVTQKHRLEGLLYATGIAYSEDAGVLLDNNTLDLALAFTDAVPKLSKTMFTFSGPSNITVSDLEHVDGSDAYWTFSATVPESYYGTISVTMNSAGRKYLRSINPAAAMPGNLTIVRADPSQQSDLITSTRG